TNHYHAKVHLGRAELVGTSYTYSSSYDVGEGWASSDFTPSSVINSAFNNLRPYLGSGAPAPVVGVNAAGNANNQRYYRVSVNGDSIGAQEMHYYDMGRFRKEISPSMLSNGSI